MKSKHRLLVYDLKKSVVQLDCEMKDEKLIHTFKTGRQACQLLIDGHLYHHNSLLRFRYDLIDNAELYQANNLEFFIVTTNNLLELGDDHNSKSKSGYMMNDHNLLLS